MASLTKNTAIMTASSVGQKILSFGYFTILARMLGAELTGKYFLALSFTTVFAVLTDVGLAPTLSREVARTPKKAAFLLGRVLTVKLFFIVAAYILVVLAANLLNYPLDTKQLVYLSGLTMVFDSLHLTFYSVLRGLQDLHYEAAGMVGSQFITLAIGSVALYVGAPVIWLIAAFTIPSFLNAIYSSYMVRHRAHIAIKLRWDAPFAKKLFVVAFPFALAGIFTRVYSFADTIMLSKLMDEVAVGWYSIPNKITFAFQFIPLALVAGLYPRMSAAFVKDKKHLAKLFEDAMKYLAMVVIPVSIGIGMLAPEIITTLYTTEYSASILPLQILLISLFFAFLDFPIGSLLNGCNRQGTQTSIMGVAMVINVVANFLMIPVWGVNGAAVAALIGNMFLMITGYAFVPSVVKFSHRKLISTLARTLIAGIAMGFVVFTTKSLFSWYFTIPLGAVVYLGILFGLRAISIDELKLFKAKI